MIRVVILLFFGGYLLHPAYIFANTPESYADILRKDYGYVEPSLDSLKEDCHELADHCIPAFEEAKRVQDNLSQLIRVIKDIQETRLSTYLSHCDLTTGIFPHFHNAFLKVNFPLVLEFIKTVSEKADELLFRSKHVYQHEVFVGSTPLEHHLKEIRNLTKLISAKLTLLIKLQQSLYWGIILGTLNRYEQLIAQGQEILSEFTNFTHLLADLEKLGQPLAQENIHFKKVSKQQAMSQLSAKNLPLQTQVFWAELQVFSEQFNTQIYEALSFLEKYTQMDQAQYATISRHKIRKDFELLENHLQMMTPLISEAYDKAFAIFKAHQASIDDKLERTPQINERFIEEYNEHLKVGITVEITIRYLNSRINALQKGPATSDLGVRDIINNLRRGSRPSLPNIHYIFNYLQETGEALTDSQKVQERFLANHGLSCDDLLK